MIKEYPKVKSEFAAVSMLLNGYSIARFGDGELKMLNGGEYAREPASMAMAIELLDALQRPHARCLPAIPTMDLKGPKGQNWQRHRERFQKVLVEDVSYYSAFISRPDSAPWINNVSYALLLEQAWYGKKVVVVCEKDGSMIKTVRLSSTDVNHIICPHDRAYRIIDKLERAIMDIVPDVAILSCGPTATCLAARLTSRGVCQAIDLGSAGGFLGKLLKQVDR